MHLGFSYLKEGKTDQALEALSRAVEIEPHSQLMLMNLAYILVDARHYDEALAWLREELARLRGVVCAVTVSAGDIRVAVVRLPLRIRRCL